MKKVRVLLSFHLDFTVQIGEQNLSFSANDVIFITLQLRLNYSFTSTIRLAALIEQEPAKALIFENVCVLQEQ